MNDLRENREGLSMGNQYCNIGMHQLPQCHPYELSGGWARAVNIGFFLFFG